ncbi:MULTISPECIES: SOS response-associated peptidase [Burkholderiaceae]|uniref:SOS response-associated peptidase n=1 Tax=Burkholderiaceae TaxID=119060 RepID=UPI00158D3956|nr:MULTISPECIES: SOS response-associated peptidase [Burkholderiaceae]MBU7436164.1 SOS response-associated peptidase [Paraburkholderia fungorum]
MCGRYSRGQGDLFYVVPLATDENDPRLRGHADIFRPSWNVSPGSQQPVITPDGPRLQTWGYRPAWAVERKQKMLINARLDKASSSAWKWMWKAHRVLVPCDGYYEWTGDPGRKQPWFIQTADGPPTYFAGLSSVREGTPPPSTPGVVDGFVIVTDAASGLLGDIHDRRPLVLTLEEAKVWLDPATTYDEAVHLANNAVKPSEAFRWHKVTPGMNRSGGGNDSPTFNDPIDD